MEDQTLSTAATVDLDGSFSGTVDWAVVGVEILPGSGGTLPAETPTPIATSTPTPAATPTPTVTQPAGSGVTHQETQGGGASGSSSVSTASNLTAVNGALYLAAIASKPDVAVSSVSGLGLSWSRVRAQCAGRDQTGVEVWMAQGTPSGTGR